MRTLIINKFLFPNGGSETYIFKLGEQLEKMGHEVQYLSNTIAALKMIILSDASKNVKKQEVKEIVDDEHLQTVLRCTNYDNEKLTRKILLDLMKSKQYGLCYILLSIKAR